MADLGHPIIESGFGLMVGNMFGVVTNKIMTTLDTKVRELVPGNNQFLEDSLTLLLHAGVLALGVKLGANSLPWLVESTPGYTLFLVGLLSGSNGLVQRVQRFNTHMGCGDGQGNHVN